MLSYGYLLLTETNSSHFHNYLSGEKKWLNLLFWSVTCYTWGDTWFGVKKEDFALILVKRGLPQSKIYKYEAISNVPFIVVDFLAISDFTTVLAKAK